MCNKMKTSAVCLIVLLFINVQAQNQSPVSSTTFPVNITSVNELHIVSDSGRSGYPVIISLTINNTDQFVAFQFDVILPSVLTFVQDSIWLFRKTNHFILANLINQQTLRVLAYSPTNAPFTGNDGVIVKIMFNLNGTSGNYDVGLNNVVISNADGVNILTGYYPGTITIIAPDISGENNIDFGEISVLDTLSYNYQLSNTGDDTLFVTDFSSSETYFWNDTPLPQNIPPGGSKTFNLKFHNIEKGDYSTIYTIRSNDPDEDPFYIDAVASSFAPNYMIMQNAEVYVGDTVNLKINVNNYEQFVDFQVDLNFPTSLTYITNSAALTDRKQDQILYENLLTQNKLRLFTYSPNQLPFLGDTGTVVTTNFVAGNDTGTFPLHLSGAMLLDSNSQNIIKASIDGVIHIRPIPTFQLSVTINNGWNIVSVPGINTNGMGVTNWWSGLTGTVYKFIPGSGYIATITTAPTEGYWMKQAGNNVYNTGDEWPAGGIQVVDHNPINTIGGWNLLGGYEDSVNVAALTTTPPAQIVYPVYKFSPSAGYQITSTIEPGYGYWVKVLSDCQINIPEVTANSNSKVANYFKDYQPDGKAGWGNITLTDAEGSSRTLYVIKGDVNLDQYELPPLPPAGIFDVRFRGGRIAEDINGTFKTIEMKGAAYPVRIKIENMDARLQDVTGKEINTNIKSGEEITISNQNINKLMISGENIPDKYSLEQNYPNPFNPSTTIEFSLPENVKNVKVSVYNVLGEKVTELVNASLIAGKYQYQWNGKNFASGIYIYELRTEKFVSIRKMILLK